MKLVMCYTVSDGCIYQCDVTTPVEYKSEEDLLCDFSIALARQFKIINRFSNF